MALLCRRPLFRRGLILLALLLGFATYPLGEPLDAQRTSQAPYPATPEEESSISLSQKQKRDLLKSNFEKMKQDADELAALAKSLQEQLNKSNEHVLSLDIVSKAEKMEKLARRIKETARGY